MKITYLGHSSFIFELGESVIVIDPFFPTTEAQQIAAETKPDLVLLTHGHEDHISGLSTLDLQSNTQIITHYELATQLQAKGLKNVIPCNLGLRFTEINDTEIRMVPAAHTSGEGGEYRGVATGFIIKHHDKVVYVAGDTSLTNEMALFPRYYDKLDAAILPVGGSYTMDWKDVPLAAELLQTNNIIGCHFDTFDAIAINTEDATKLCTGNNVQLRLPKIGETFDV